MSKELIAILTNREKYYRFRPFIKDHTVPKETRTIINDFDEYFSSNPSVDDIDISTFNTWFSVMKHSSMKPAAMAIYHEIFKNTEDVLKSGLSTSAEDIMEALIERDYATRVADLSLKVAEGDDKVTLMECESVLEQYQTESKRARDDEDTLIATDINDLVVDLKGGLEFRLKELQLSLGPLRKGNFIVVAKLPESGGTAFAISEASYMLDQLKDKQKILYFGNEETGEAVRQRIISAVTGLTWKQVKADPIKANDLFNHVDGNRIEIHAVHGRNIRAIEKIIKRKDAALIIIDQLWKVHGYDKAGSEVSKITELFKKARELAAEYAPVIAIHQADGTAYNSVYAGMEQMYMSRIGVQGEADAIITIGVSQEPGKERQRYINVPKNKLPGGGISQEMYRHYKWEVEIIPELSTYRGMK